METRLRSTLRRIHWSLVLKAGGVAVAWLLFPWYVFLAVALYFYFVPLFHPSKLLFPFLIFLFLALESPLNLGFALLLGSLFYVILGIKDLILIDRRSAYDILTLTLIFLLDIWFFFSFGDSGGYSAAVSALLLSGVVSFLFWRSLAYAHPHWLSPQEARRMRMVSGAAWFFVSQLSLVVLFLPISALFQAILVFFLSAVVLALLSLHLESALTRNRVLVYFSATFVFLVAVFGFLSWSP